ncbi:hypothetical protein [Rhizobium leguminosarum]|uniref:hypothetical protein n=1 Tax=Rhizobium leguminosarum TaxID=384 RepID=UPI001619ECD0|nr:hypothetical protein [Rhizobium leguminosarum]MBB4465428.1 hypothetical protein [Rhizobium leguminosarum]MBB4472090.1 hypothetical protein [Rhizobium leguminosarum]
MFNRFRFDRIPLSLIKLDERNPRIVTQKPLRTEDEIVGYLFEHEGLASFLKKIASEGRNQGAERPYVVKEGREYVVLEGNTRIAAYKLLTGVLSPPEEHAGSVPHIPTPMREDLSTVDCSIAPSRDALLPIMANSHFGLGDKSRWGYLGSRKAVFDEWKGGKSISQLASAFDRKPGSIRDLLLEYQLYLEAVKLDWTAAELAELVRPEVEFNPPVRFLQSTGHKSAVGIDFDRTNLTVIFKAPDAKRKFRHLIKKLVIDNEKGLGATSSYQEVFSDYVSSEPVRPEPDPDTSTGGAPGPDSQPPDEAPPQPEPQPQRGKNALFNYPVSSNSALLIQLITEAKSLNTQKYPAAGTALLRSILEAILKSIVLDQGANPQGKLLSLETAIDICLSNAVQLSHDDKRILKEFKRSHLDYVNMGTHASVVPNSLRLAAARDCVDQFVMRSI